MKKIYLFILAIFSGILASNAQSIKVTRNSDGAVISDNDLMYVSAPAGGLPAETDFTFKNIGASTKSFKVKRIDVQLNKVNVPTGDTAEPYFCTGLNCYPSTTTITPSAITLTVNGTESLITYLQEASVEGVSTVKYEIYDIANTSDKLTFTISYNNPLSVKNNNALFSSVSEVFPNPANNRAQLTVHSSSTSLNNSLTITNALGSIVSSKSVAFNSGKNLVLLDVENLTNGIYFVTLTNGNTKIVKKFTITQ